MGLILICLYLDLDVVHVFSAFVRFMHEIPPFGR
jgi:hypothetical protein